jgi:tetratricopeptide (TPR) repeat protein
MIRIRSQVIFLLFLFPICLLAQAQKAESLWKEIEQRKYKDTVMVNLLIQYSTEITNTDHNKAFQKATEAYELAKHLKYESGIAWAAIRISIYHAFYSLECDETIKYALEALKIGEAIHDKKVQSKAYTYMAVCYSKSNDSITLLYMERAVSLAEEDGDDDIISAALMNLAIAHLEQKNYGIAIKYLERVRGYAQKTGNEYIIMGVYSNLARAYKGLNNFEAALESYRNGIEYARKQKNYRYLSIQLLQVGEIYQSRNDIKKAFEFILESLKVAEENHLKECAMEAYSALSRIYSETGKYKEAYAYQSKYYSIADSINNLQSGQNMERMQQKFKLEKEKLQAEQEAKAEEEKKYNQFLAIGLAILGLSILVVLLSGTIVVRPGMVKITGILGLLITFEFLNLLLHPFLERITNHSPLLMLAFLAGIAGLLIPLHHRMEKWVTAKLVEKNKKIHLASARKLVAEEEGARGNEQ